MQSSLHSALSKEGFVKGSGIWLRMLFEGAITAASVSREIERFLSHASSLVQTEREVLSRVLAFVDETVRDTSLEKRLALEHAVWPATLTDVDLPAFIVPIKPLWAQHLFDEEIASGQLFGARPDLALNDEAIYYRSSRNSRGLRAPSRLLWYVSRDVKVLPTGQLRALSHLREVTIGPATETYRRFRRLGIYEWRDVLATAGGDPNSNVMALRFGKTRMLAHPVSHRDLQNRLRAQGVKTQLQSPVEIPPRTLIGLAYDMPFN
jgi:hypothetical protein